MQISYRITEVFPDEHQIIVRFWSDVTPEESLSSQNDEHGNMLRCRTDYALNLPIPAPTGSDLHQFIMGHCPVGWFEMKAAVADENIDTSMNAILTLKGVDVAA